MNKYSDLRRSIPLGRRLRNAVEGYMGLLDISIDLAKMRVREAIGIPAVVQCDMCKGTCYDYRYIGGSRACIACLDEELKDARKMLDLEDDDDDDEDDDLEDDEDDLDDGAKKPSFEWPFMPEKVRTIFTQCELVSRNQSAYFGVIDGWLWAGDAHMFVCVGRSFDGVQDAAMNLGCINAARGIAECLANESDAAPMKLGAWGRSAEKTEYVDAPGVVGESHYGIQARYVRIIEALYPNVTWRCNMAVNTVFAFNGENVVGAVAHLRVS